ncbi:hypothetical protein [Asticcacaulis taihuensis]|uniref:hypothetical protein n=1 Tax=Asticcacaulis taihuensis TaxID=260084 RepID=UPI00147AF2B5|nr:hypothetical protein [Asticcacaulis taihuensis]
MSNFNNFKKRTSKKHNESIGIKLGHILQGTAEGKYGITALVVIVAMILWKAFS